DLKQLFIGGEGTLGIITQATLKLFPAPKSKATAIIASKKVEDLMSTFSFLQNQFGETLTAFEIFPVAALKMVLDHIPGTRAPFSTPFPWYAVIDLWETGANDNLAEDFGTALEKTLDSKWIGDAVIAKSETEARAFWVLRETIAEAQKMDGDGIKHDVSVPLDKIPEFFDRADSAVENIIPGIKKMGFGHAGDGNIHYDPCPPDGMDQATFLGFRAEVNRAVHDIVADLEGSISAEHGIGTTRLMELMHYKPEIDLELFRAIKKSFDPKGLMNPGKLIP
ncbi:MAG: FAD-binding oxidoreductase, partial [Sphingomonadales bacterium]